MQARIVPALSCSLALALSAAPSAASDGEEWLTLERELELLAQAPQATSDGGVSLGVLLRSNYAWFEESPVTPGEHYSGFALDNVRPWIEGRVGGTTLRLTLEAQSGTALVLDAFARMAATEDVALTLGRFQPAVLRSALVEPQNQLFVLRTAPGAFWQARDTGVELAATLDTVLLRASLLNGTDGAGDEPAVAVRADWSAVGTVPLVEGAYGSGRQTCLALGGAWYDDANALEDGDVLGADAILTTDRFSLAGEFQSYADDGGVDPGSGVKNGIYGNFSDASPWSATASFMVDPEKYELGLRYETLDDQYDASAVTVGLNAYLAGHDLMWQVNFSQVDSDRADQDGGVFGIGLTVNI